MFGVILIGGVGFGRGVHEGGVGVRGGIIGVVEVWRRVYFHGCVMIIAALYSVQRCGEGFIDFRERGIVEDLLESKPQAKNVRDPKH